MKKYSVAIRNKWVYRALLWPSMAIFALASGEWMHTGDHAHAVIVVPFFLVVNVLMTKRRNHLKQVDQSMMAIANRDGDKAADAWESMSREQQKAILQILSEKAR